MRRLRRHALPALLLASALAALGCTGDSEQAAATATTASPSATATATAVPTGTPTTTRSLTTSATGSGRISPLPGTYSYLDGDGVTVTARPDEGYAVASWGGHCSGTATTCTLTMDADKTASVTFELPQHTLTVTVTGPGGGVTPSGTTEQDANSEVTLTASWNDATHSFTGWTGGCVATTSTCVVTMDADKTVTATFTALPATRCATPAAADCVRAVYRGAPGDYAQVADIPADKLLTADTGGHYYVERGEQYTVVTAAPLPAGWTRFYLQRDPAPAFGVPSPVSASQLIKPVGTTYTFTVSEDDEAPPRFTFELKAAKPHPLRPNLKPILGDTVVTTVFHAPTFTYNRFDTTGAATTAGSYAFLMPDADSETEGATTVVTTYEQLRTESTVLRVNVTNADGVSLGGFYDSVEVGDIVEWFRADDCWARYQITDVPEPTVGSVPREIRVSWIAYAYAGCMGTVAPAFSIEAEWDPAPVTSGPIATRSRVATTPIRYGPWLLHPFGDYSALEHQAFVEPTGIVPSSPTQTGDLAVARTLPFWRDPSLPAGWSFRSARAGLLHTPVYGYCADYNNTRGYKGVEICGFAPLYLPDYRSVPYDGSAVIKEVRHHQGVLLLIEYSPDGPDHVSSFAPRVWILDRSTGAHYEVAGYGQEFTGTANLGALIDIAVSLLQGVAR